MSGWNPPSWLSVLELNMTMFHVWISIIFPTKSFFLKNVDAYFWVKRKCPWPRIAAHTSQIMIFIEYFRSQHGIFNLRLENQGADIGESPASYTLVVSRLRPKVRREMGTKKQGHIPQRQKKPLRNPITALHNWELYKFSFKGWDSDLVHESYLNIWSWKLYSWNPHKKCNLKLLKSQPYSRKFWKSPWNMNQAPLVLTWHWPVLGWRVSLSSYS